MKTRLGGRSAAEVSRRGAKAQRRRQNHEIHERHEKGTRVPLLARSNAEEGEMQRRREELICFCRLCFSWLFGAVWCQRRCCLRSGPGEASSRSRGSSFQ